MRYLTVTIDVEPDCTPGWHYSRPLTFNGVQIGIKNRLQPLFNKYQIRPTYLINNVVLEDAESVETLKNLKGDFELGTHLHPEFIEPQKKFYDYSGKDAKAIQCSLDSNTEFEKMKNITLLFEKCFNKKPLSFRAGRFGAGINTVKCLQNLGYKVDTSVTPHINWGFVDYTDLNEQPYFIKEGTLLKQDSNGTVLEIPVSIIKKRKFIREKTYWLRPVYSDYKNLVMIVDEYSKKYEKNGIVIYNMMFHNVEVLPENSPYTRTERDCEKYIKNLDIFFTYCKKEEIESLTLSGAYSRIQYNKLILKEGRKT